MKTFTVTGKKGKALKYFLVVASSMGKASNLVVEKGYYPTSINENTNYAEVLIEGAKK